MARSISKLGSDRIPIKTGSGSTLYTRIRKFVDTVQVQVLETVPATVIVLDLLPIPEEDDGWESLLVR